MTKAYSAKTIKTLEGMEHIRHRAGMYIGSVGENGLHHILLEIISNSVDEFLNGSGNHITVKLFEDGSVMVQDNARGIPHGKMPNGNPVLREIFGTLNTGGKYDNEGNSGYNTSGGMNGVGAKATNALSERFFASSSREGYCETVEFSRGKFIAFDRKPIKADMHQQGTTVIFKPDATIFETVEYNVTRLRNTIKEMSYLCSGLTFDLIIKDKTETYFSQNGLLDYILDLNKGKKSLLSAPFYTNISEGTNGVEVALLYNESYSDTVKLYSNNIPNTGGTHLTGFRTAFTRAINEYAKDKKLLKDGDDNFTGDDLKEGQLLIVNLKMVAPIYQGQNKEVLTSSEGRTITERLVAKEIRLWLEANPADAKAIITKAELTRKAREAARKAREATRKKATAVLSSVLPGKLADCSSKVVEDCEIYLVEGDSAGGSAKQARDRATQAILPLRGKVLNTLKNDKKAMDANKEIQDMITAFGCGIGESFDISKRRYDKIVIMTDGDVDGAHIRTLLLTFLFKHLRPLVEAGHVYAAMPPLYKVTKGKDSVYLLDDSELAEYKKQYPNAQLTVSRFKGLGEMDAEQLAETTMDRTKRRLKQITIDDAAKAALVFEKLMGNSVAPRREFIEQNAYRANLDI